MRQLILVICVLAVTAACTQNKQVNTKVTADTSSKKVARVQYTCAMHPDVLSATPGTCPKCGMQLVEKDNTKK